MNVRILGVAATMLMVGSVASADLINFDWERDSFVPNIPIHSGPAAIGSAGDFWNSGEAEFVFTYPGLLDADGNVTTAQLDVVNFGSFSDTAADFGSPLNDLMRDYAFTNPSVNNSVGTATISGLAANTEYTLYLYGVSNSAGQNTTFSVTSANEGAQTVTSPDLLGPLTLTDDYVIFTGSTSGTGTIDITVDGSGNFSAWNGFQLDIVPEPASIALLGLDGLMMLKRKR